MTDIIVLLDESLSMSAFRSMYIKGVNNIINNQKNINPNILFTMVKFNNKVNIMCLDNNISELTEFKLDHYKPDGSTALYDAIGTLTKMKGNQEGRKIIMVIITDGEDNVSTEYGQTEINRIIRYLSNEKGWVFIYVAAHPDANITGRRLGIETCVQYDEKSIENAIHMCNVSIGHVISEYMGKHNKYSNHDISNDVRNLMLDLEKISLI